MMIGKMVHLGIAAAVLAIAGPALAQAIASDSLSTAVGGGDFGIVRVRIDPAVGEQDAEIRKLLGTYAFVRIGEPADYLVTTQPDFPLDIALVDLRQPRQHWRGFDSDFQAKVPEPRQFAIGNLRAEGTGDRLTRLLVAASRLRAILDRSLADMHGVDTCLLVGSSAAGGSMSGECVALGAKDSRHIFNLAETGGLGVLNRTNADRYVSIIAADGSFKVAPFGSADEQAVWKLAPGAGIEFQPRLAANHNPDDPRVMLLVSTRPFTIDELAQPSPLEPECAYALSPHECVPKLTGVALNGDLAVRSFQLIVPPEPQPAMGNGWDVTAMMAVWMAQFYSVLPYSRAEIEADSRLPDDQRLFLASRSYEERQHRCGATLIGPNLVLTAAHCVAKGQYAGVGLAKLLKERRVRLGTRKLGKGGQSFAIAAVAVHAGYDPARVNNDLALLLLQPDRDKGAIDQRPITVADRPLPGAVDALGFGWGFTGAVAPNGNIMMSLESRLQHNPDVLQYGEMTSVTLDQCRRKLAALVAPGMVCMYSKAALEGAPSADGVFTCRGDSGGPLVRKVRGRDVLVGVVSWSMGCGYKDYPSVFTDVGSYARWIAAARAQLKPGMAIRTADPARPAGGRAGTSP
jgi:hypothetical protein